MAKKRVKVSKYKNKPAYRPLYRKLKKVKRYLGLKFKRNSILLIRISNLLSKNIALYQVSRNRVPLANNFMTKFNFKSQNLPLLGRMRKRKVNRNNSIYKDYYKRKLDVDYKKKLRTLLFLKARKEKVSHQKSHKLLKSKFKNNSFYRFGFVNQPDYLTKINFNKVLYL